MAADPVLFVFTLRSVEGRPMEVEKLYERLKMGGVTEIAQYLNVSTRRDTLFVFSLRLNVPVTLS